MVPNRSVLLEELPLTERGKVDRAALPAPGREGGDVADTRPDRRDRWPRSSASTRSAPDEDFFALGGDSLLAIRLVGRLRDRLGTELGIGAVFEAPHPARARRAARRRADRRAALPPLRTGHRGAERPGRPPPSAAPGCSGA